MIIILIANQYLLIRQLFLVHSQLKHSHFLTLLIILSVYQIQASLLDVLIIFVNIFHFNLVVMFACFTFVSSVINSIYLKQLVILYRVKLVGIEGHTSLLHSRIGNLDSKFCNIGP